MQLGSEYDSGIDSERRYQNGSRVTRSLSQNPSSIKLVPPMSNLQEPPIVDVENAVRPPSFTDKKARRLGKTSSNPQLSVPLSVATVEQVTLVQSDQSTTDDLPPPAPTDPKHWSARLLSLTLPRTLVPLLGLRGGSDYGDMISIGELRGALKRPPFSPPLHSGAIVLELGGHRIAGYTEADVREVLRQLCPPSTMADPTGASSAAPQATDFTITFLKQGIYRIHSTPTQYTHFQCLNQLSTVSAHEHMYIQSKYTGRASFSQRSHVLIPCGAVLLIDSLFSNLLPVYEAIACSLRIH